MARTTKGIRSVRIRKCKRERRKKNLRSKKQMTNRGPTEVQSINWTNLPESLPQRCLPNVGHLSPESGCEESSVRSSLALLRELEVSLQNSQKALLSRDAGAMEKETREQKRMQQALRDLWRAAGIPARSRVELRATASRILHLGHVQLALLARARRSLHALSQLAAGLSASYNPPRAPWPPANHEEAGPLCQV
jgi:hypothetical protein